METIKWIAGNGKEVKISDGMTVSLGGMICGFEKIENGIMICRNVKIKIPVEFTESVFAMQKHAELATAKKMNILRECAKNDERVLNAMDEYTK